MTTEDEIDQLTKELELTPVAKLKVFQAFAAAKPGKGFLASLKPFALLKAGGDLTIEERAIALRAEKQKRMKTDPAFAAQSDATDAAGLRIKLTGAEAKIASLTTEAATFSATIADLQGKLTAKDTAFKALESSFTQRVNAAVVEVVASNGHAPLPIGASDNGGGFAPERNPSARERLKEATRAEFAAKGQPTQSEDHPWNGTRFSR